MAKLSLAFLVCFTVSCLGHVQSSAVGVPQLTETTTVYEDVQPAEDTTDHTSLVVEGVDVSKLSESSLEDFVNALDEKFVSDVDLWVGKQQLAEYTAHELSGRQKRWVPLAIRGGMFAFNAGRRLYRAAKLYKTSRSAGKLTRQYNRRGNYRKAVSDFHRLRPTNVKRFNGPKGVSGLTGRMGKYTVQVRNKSSGGKPTLELFKTAKGDRRVHRKVRYNN